MKYRIYRYAVKNGTIQNVKVDIKTDDIEAERKNNKMSLDVYL